MSYKKIFLICRDYSKTPIVKWYAELMQERGIIVKENIYDKNRKKNRLDFIYNSIKSVVFESNKNDLVLCVGFQSLPVLILSWFFDRAWVYWKLESPKAFDNWSLVLKLQLIEWIINRNSVLLVLPSFERLKIQKPSFSKSHIVYNAPTSFFIDKIKSRLEISDHEKCKSFVLYGNLAKGSVYLDEWIEFFTDIYCDAREFELTLIGRSFNNQFKGISKNISYLGEISHSDLISKLSSGFGYSLVGYKATSQNTIYAAPNKLLESLSCGIPIIGHYGNPYVKEIVEKYNCGFLIDFENISYSEIKSNILNWDFHRKSTLVAAHAMALDMSIKESILDVGQDL